MLKLIKEWIGRQSWTFAKTYAKKAPHEYVHASKVLPEDRKFMVTFARYIQENGYEEKFWSKSFKYVNINGYKYWTMDFPIEKTDLVNRAKLGVEK